MSRINKAVLLSLIGLQSLAAVAHETTETFKLKKQITSEEWDEILAREKDLLEDVYHDNKANMRELRKITKSLGDLIKNAYSYHADYALTQTSKWVKEKTDIIKEKAENAPSKEDLKKKFKDFEEKNRKAFNKGIKRLRKKLPKENPEIVDKALENLTRFRERAVRYFSKIYN